MTTRNSSLMPIRNVEDMFNDPPLAWLVEGLIPANGLVTIYGPSNKGKTFIALNLLLHVAYGMPFFSRITQRGRAYYIAGEGGQGIASRVMAFKKSLGISAQADMSVINHIFSMRDPASVDSLINSIREDAQRTGGKPSIICVDTLNRFYGPGDENTAADMSKFIHSCDRIRTEFDCAVVIVHHTGKDCIGLRGSSVLPSAMDAIFSVSASGMETVVECEKQKEDECGQRFFLKRQKVEFTHPKTGKLLRSLFFEFDREGAGKSQATLTGPQLNKLGAIAFEALMAAGQGGLTEQELRDILKQKAGRQSPRSADFADAKQELSKKGLMIEKDGKFIIAGVH